MNYFDILNNLQGHTKIVVTGPQRSGTTIAAHILSQDLKFTCFFEESFKTSNAYEFVNLIKNNNNFVIQAPALSSIMHYFLVTIVFMRRNISDILKSQERINWTSLEFYEKRKYFNDTNEPIAKTKYFVWDKYQKPYLKNAFDLDYDSLKHHNLWVDKKNRLNFSSRQIKNTKNKVWL